MYHVVLAGTRECRRGEEGGLNDEASIPQVRYATCTRLCSYITHQ